MAIYKRNNEKTENPCVTGSIPVQGTIEKQLYQYIQLFYIFLKTI